MLIEIMSSVIDFNQYNILINIIIKVFPIFSVLKKSNNLSNAFPSCHICLRLSQARCNSAAFHVARAEGIEERVAKMNKDLGGTWKVGNHPCHGMVSLQPIAN